MLLSRGIFKNFVFHTLFHLTHLSHGRFLCTKMITITHIRKSIGKTYNILYNNSKNCYMFSLYMYLVYTLFRFALFHIFIIIQARVRNSICCTNIFFWGKNKSRQKEERLCTRAMIIIQWSVSAWKERRRKAKFWNI